MVQAMIFQSPDIQKILAFEGAFEKLFNIVTQEAGIEGGVVAHGALICVDSLLRFNSSNQVRLDCLGDLSVGAYRNLTSELLSGDATAPGFMLSAVVPSKSSITRSCTSRIRIAVLG